jgi:thioredoxin reductase (NADPH)
VYLVAEKLSIADEMQERLDASNVEILIPNWVKEIHGKTEVTGVTLTDGSQIDLDGIFIELGSKGALELATQVGVALDTERFKYIDTNRRQETNIPGIYAAGDIVGPPYQMAKAVGEGCVAGMGAATYARKQKNA